MSMPPPDVGQVARQVMGAMIVLDPVSPLAWATARDEHGRAIYTVAVALGADNCDALEKTLEDVRGRTKAVDYFDSDGKI